MDNKKPESILNLNANATKEEVTKAYRAAAKKLHPDKKGGSTEEFQRLGQEYNDFLLHIKNREEAVGAKKYPVYTELQKQHTKESKSHAKKPTTVENFYRKTTFRVSFDEDASAVDRVRCLFEGLSNNFGLPAKPVVNEPIALYSEGKKIGAITFIKSVIKKHIIRMDESRDSEEKQVKADPIPRLK